MTHVIAEPCLNKKDGSCVEVCPVDCIHTTPESDLFYINPDECIDCGACVPVCPHEAIFAEEDLPEKWNSYKEVNAKFFNA